MKTSSPLLRTSIVLEKAVKQFCAGLLGWSLIVGLVFGGGAAWAGSDSDKNTGKRQSIVLLSNNSTQAPKYKTSKAQAIKSPSVKPTEVAVRSRLSKGNVNLRLSSSVAYVVDQETQEVLFNKNGNAILPIASITKIMTAVTLREMGLPMQEKIKITREDIRSLKGMTRSRLRAGDVVTREHLLLIMLMSSENVAANALARTSPVGFKRFIRGMNSKALVLGMLDTSYEDASGLSSKNRSSARDLATLLAYAHADPVLRRFSTTKSYRLSLKRRKLNYSNTNPLIKRSSWDIGLQKTGFIRAAGRCLIMQAEIAGRNLLMVFLDAKGKRGRVRDAERLKTWLKTQVGTQVALGTGAY